MLMVIKDVNGENRIQDQQATGFFSLEKLMNKMNKKSTDSNRD